MIESAPYDVDGNRLAGINGVAVNKDPAGNITNGGAGVTFTYGPRNRMTSSTNAQGTTTYSYNALGERVKKSGLGGTVKKIRPRGADIKSMQNPGSIPG